VKFCAEIQVPKNKTELASGENPISVRLLCLDFFPRN